MKLSRFGRLQIALHSRQVIGDQFIDRLCHAPPGLTLCHEGGKLAVCRVVLLPACAARRSKAPFFVTT